MREGEKRERERERSTYMYVTVNGTKFAHSDFSMVHNVLSLDTQGLLGNGEVSMGSNS